MSLYIEIGILFLIMGIGFYGKKRKILSEETDKGLSSLLMDITLPLLIISSFNLKYSYEMLNNIIKSLLYSIIAFTIAIAISSIIFAKVKNGKKDILKFCGVFCNCGFMGFPIIESIFGKEGLIYASIFNMIFTSLIWTYGLKLYSGKKVTKDFRKVIINPGIIAVVIGILIILFSIQIPLIIKSTLEIIGGMTTPIAMIITGSMMAGIQIKNQIKDKNLYIGVLVRLLIVPLVLYAITIPFKISSIPVTTILIAEAMPVGATASIFSQIFNKEKELSATLVFISTLLSVVTIPMVVWIIS